MQAITPLVRCRSIQLCINANIERKETHGQASCCSGALAGTQSQGWRGTGARAHGATMRMNGSQACRAGAFVAAAAAQATVMRKHKRSRKNARKVPKLAWDFDGDGDVDLHDARLVIGLIFTSLYLIFDVTTTVIPFGALIGGFISTVAHLIGYTRIRRVVDTLSEAFAELSSEGVLPTHIKDVWDLLPRELQFMNLEPLCIGYFVIVFTITLLIIVNGFYVGLRRGALSESIDKSTSRLCLKQCRKDCAWCVFCECNCWKPCSQTACLRWSFTLVQSCLALFISTMLWIFLALAYTVSVLAIVFWLASFAFQKYCTYGEPWVDKGLVFTSQGVAAFKPIMENMIAPVVNGVVDAVRASIPHLELLATDVGFSQKLAQFLNSPIYLILNLIGDIFGYGQDHRWFLPIIERSLDYVEVTNRMCRLNRGLPDVFLGLLVCAIAAMVGTYILSDHHTKVSTVFYYQTKLRRARSQAEACNQAVLEGVHA